MKKYLFTSIIIFLFSNYVFSQSAVKHILLEEFSTAPCGFCPDGDLVAAQLIIDHPPVIWLTHHAGFGTDSMTIPESVTIANAFTTFAPGATIDRGDYPIPIYTYSGFIAISRQKWDSVVVAHLNDPPVVDVSIINNYDPVTRLLNCTVQSDFITTPTAGDLRLNLFLVEDSVVGFGNGYDQKNYYNTTPGHPYYNAGDPIVGYVHHHVMRKVVTGTWGMMGVIPGAPVAGSSYSHTFNSISIPANWKEEDMDVIAFVSYYDPSVFLRQVINANHKLMLDSSVTTGISDLNSDADGISVYPNPASEYLIIDLQKEKDNSEIKIFDPTGKIVLQKNLDARYSLIDTRKLNSGFYFYEIKGEGGTFFRTGKIVKQ
ncbi:MAG: Omp28-related outer membrane protein [Bacteroidia bacterium]